MAFAAAIAESVGLQILLQPSSTTVVFRAACSIVGVVYPVYESLKAIEGSQQPQLRREKQQQWLTYWAAYSSWALLEQHASKLLTWFPWYYQCKLAFLLWLQLPTYQGARRLYLRFVQPLLLKHQPHIDETLKHLHDSLVQPKFVSMAEAVRKAAISVPVLGWFARTPAEDEAMQRQEQSPPPQPRRRGQRHQPAQQQRFWYSGTASGGSEAEAGGSSDDNSADWVDTGDAGTAEPARTPQRFRFWGGNG